MLVCLCRARLAGGSREGEFEVELEALGEAVALGVEVVVELARFTPVVEVAGESSAMQRVEEQRGDGSGRRNAAVLADAPRRRCAGRHRCSGGGWLWKWLFIALKGSLMGGQIGLARGSIVWFLCIIS